MNLDWIIVLAGLAALLPAALYPIRGTGRGGAVYWLVLGLGLLGSGSVLAAGAGSAWDAGFSTALWLVVFSTLALFALLAGFMPVVRPLALILFPYLFLLALLAAIWHGAGMRVGFQVLAEPWILIHIPISLLTYAATTLAAAAALAVLLREAAVKEKRPKGFAARLPAIADGERLELQLMITAEAVLTLGLLTGMAALYATSGRVFVLDHKTLLSLVVFALLAALILLHYLSGVRGRFGARLLLVAYLCLTLAYPGVKFVVDILLGP